MGNTEHTDRITIPGPNRLKKVRYGTLLYNPNDRYVGKSLDLYGEFSNEESGLFQSLLKPGAIALDIGAHIGPHTLVIAAAVGSEGAVLAFEPQRVLFQMLCANMALNNHTTAYCYHAVVGDRPGTLVVPELDYSTENNFAGLALGDYQAGERVRMLTVDSLDLQRCDFMKIDVEGMELDVLKGAQKTITRFKPALYVENDREEKSAALIAHIRSLEYDLYWHRPPLFNPNNFTGYQKDVFAGIVSINMLCFHHSLKASVDGLEKVA
ncbi:MAG: FkbM family methyltransferase [Desulfobacterales bacterium]|nr:FkbM family methyltransferase [Desulfobacterales bacterium]